MKSQIFYAYLGLLRAEIRHDFIWYGVNITKCNTNGFLSRYWPVSLLRQHSWKLENGTNQHEKSTGLITLKMHQAFSVHLTPEELKKKNNHRSFSGICVWWKLGQWNHVIIVTSSFSKAGFSVHTKTKSRRFQIPPVWKAFSKCCLFVTDLAWTVGLTN